MVNVSRARGKVFLDSNVLKDKGDGMAKRLTKAKKEKLNTMLQEGLSVKEVSDQLGVSHTIVVYYKNKMNGKVKTLKETRNEDNALAMCKQVLESSFPQPKKIALLKSILA